MLRQDMFKSFQNANSSRTFLAIIFSCGFQFMCLFKSIPRKLKDRVGLAQSVACPPLAR